MALRFGSSNYSCRFSATCRPPSALVSMSTTYFYPGSCSVPPSEGLLEGFFPSLCSNCVVCQHSSDTHVLFLLCWVRHALGTLAGETLGWPQGSHLRSMCWSGAGYLQTLGLLRGYSAGEP